jgi:hypothetical protein
MDSGLEVSDGDPPPPLLLETRLRNWELNSVASRTQNSLFSFFLPVPRQFEQSVLLFSVRNTHS